MVHRFLVSCSFVCCAVVIASFGFFAVDQVSGASSEQAAQIASGSPTPPAKAPAHHGAVRRIVDSAAKYLTYPFHSLLRSASKWANQLLLLVLGLTVYGVGLGYLARYSSGLP
jgi:hypothetical protein